MNARDEWPAPEEVPQWLRDRPLTPDQIESMRKEYELAQIEDAQSAAAFEANQQEYAK